MAPRRRSAAALWSVGALVLTAGLATAALGSPAAVGTGPAPAFLRLVYHGNLSIAGIGPDLAAPVESNLTIAYEVRDAGFVPDQSGLYVRVPGSVVNFNVSGQPQPFDLPAKIVPIASTNWTSPANTTFYETLPQATDFTGGPGTNRSAVLSTQAVALTSPLPYGAVQLEVRWSWTLTPSLEAPPASSNWLPTSNGSVVTPDEYAAFQLPNGGSVAAGGSVTGCVSGGVANRTFSMQLATVHPLDDFAQSNATVPPGTSGPYCWGIPVPSYLPPQTLNLRLWDYANASAPSGPTTVLLDSLSVRVTPPSSPTPSYEDPVYWGTAAGVAAALIAAGLLFRFRSRRPGPPARTMPAAPARAAPGATPPAAPRPPR